MRSDAELIQKVKESLRYADACQKNTERYERAAGRDLRILKNRKPHNISWVRFVRKHFNLSQERADELIRIAENKTTSAKVRKRRRDSMRKTRANRSSVPRGTETEQNPEPNQSNEEKVVENLDQENPDAPVTAFMFQLTGALIAFRNCEKLLPMIINMETPPHAEDWKELLLSAHQRADQFSSLVDQLEAITPKTTRRKIPILSVVA